MGDNRILVLSLGGLAFLFFLLVKRDETPALPFNRGFISVPSSLRVSRDSLFAGPFKSLRRDCVSVLSEFPSLFYLVAGEVSYPSMEE